LKEKNDKWSKSADYYESQLNKMKHGKYINQITKYSIGNKRINQHDHHHNVNHHKKKQRKEAPEDSSTQDKEMPEKNYKC